MRYVAKLPKHAAKSIFKNSLGAIIWTERKAVDVEAEVSCSKEEEVFLSCPWSLKYSSDKLGPRLGVLRTVYNYLSSW